MNDSGFSEGEGGFTQKDEDRFAIDAILAKEGVRDQVRSLSDRLAQLPGSTMLFAMRPDGLLVAVRGGCSDSDDGYYKAFAVDANTPPDEFANATVEVDLSVTDVSSPRGTGSTRIPAHALAERLEETAQLSEEQIQATVPEKERALALFYKRTGGISIPFTSKFDKKRTGPTGFRPPPPQEPKAGGKPLYPIPQL